MHSFFYDDLVLEIRNESTYTLASADNHFEYAKVYASLKVEEDAQARFGIRLFRNDLLIDSCILLSEGWETIPHKHVAVVDVEQVVICCGNHIFCLERSTLNLRWQLRADDCSCFQVFYYAGNYIVHGEMAISRVDKKGNIVWQFSGADIFVSMDDEESFQIQNDGILLTDFYKTKYKIDFDGKLLWDSRENNKARVSSKQRKESINGLPFPRASTANEDISHVGIAAVISVMIYGITKAIRKLIKNK